MAGDRPYATVETAVRCGTNTEISARSANVDAPWGVAPLDGRRRAALPRDQDPPNQPLIRSHRDFEPVGAAAAGAAAAVAGLAPFFTTGV